MAEKKLNINQWAAEDRPREKMMAHGASALSDAELLAILIGSGNTDETAVELMRRVMAECENDLARLGEMNLTQLCRFKGIGPAKAITILAASELGRRRELLDKKSKPRIRLDSSKEIYNYFYPLMWNLPIEECWVVLLNQALRVIDRVKVSMGGLTATAVDIRCVLREAILHRATAIALCHNHPSGNVRPSADDNRLTEKLSHSASLMNIRLIDHIVLTDGSYFSYADEGLL